MLAQTSFGQRCKLLYSVLFPLLPYSSMIVVAMFPEKGKKLSWLCRKRYSMRCKLRSLGISTGKVLRGLCPGSFPLSFAWNKMTILCCFISWEANESKLENKNRNQERNQGWKQWTKGEETERLRSLGTGAFWTCTASSGILSHADK